MKFTATIESTGKNTTGIPVPNGIVEALGSGKRPAVEVTVGGHSYRSSIASVGGAFMISLSAENRAKAGVGAGDQVEVEVQLDTRPREVIVPADLADALAKNLGAQRAFDGLSYSKKRWHVLNVEGAQTEATRQRRIAKSIEILRREK